MLFRQLAHPATRSFAYLIGSRVGGEAVLIDPVREMVALYLRLIEALDLKLVCALGTHGRGEASRGLAVLREQMGCAVAMGDQTRTGCANRLLSDGEVLDLEGLKIEALHTPGHSPDSYSFVMDDRVFTGDTLLIDETGRTDLEGGDPGLQYDSLFTKLLPLPGCSLVYPAHDYTGRSVSTIAEQRRSNPRLQVNSVDEYVARKKENPGCGAPEIRTEEEPSGTRHRQVSGNGNLQQSA